MEWFGNWNTIELSGDPEVGHRSHRATKCLPSFVGDRLIVQGLTETGQSLVNTPTFLCGRGRERRI